LELCDSSNKNGRINCEYIFIVDCSGSMADENKIGYARQAMSIFLKSLPIGSYFNIFRFGSEYKQFKKDQITIEYNEQTAKEANDYINQMKVRRNDLFFSGKLFNLILLGGFRWNRTSFCSFSFTSQTTSNKLFSSNISN
jgi:hypothetical protein